MNSNCLSIRKSISITLVVCVFAIWYILVNQISDRSNVTNAWLFSDCTIDPVEAHLVGGKIWISMKFICGQKGERVHGSERKRQGQRDDKKEE